MSVPLSVVIIAFNEAKRLPECLASVEGLADEVVVLDSGSTDETVALAARAGARVEHQSFLGYVAQKNKALDLATHDLVLSLDADEALSPELYRNLLALKSKAEGLAFEFNRRNWYCGRFIRHGSWYPDRKIRLWDRRLGRWAGEGVHEFLDWKGSAKPVWVEGDLLHYTIEKVKDHWQQVLRYTDLAAGDLKQKSWGYLFAKWVVNPWYTFVKGYFLKAGFLDGWQGLAIAFLSAIYDWRKFGLALLRKLAD